MHNLEDLDLAIKGLLKQFFNIDDSTQTILTNPEMPAKIVKLEDAKKDISEEEIRKKYNDGLMLPFPTGYYLGKPRRMNKGGGF